MTLTLYHHNSSVCAAKVRVALAEKDLAWTSHLLRLDGDQFDPAYLALNPAAVVPTLVHDGTFVTESTVILDYLDDAFRENMLRPDGPADRAAARGLMMRLDSGSEGLHHAASVVTYAIAYRMRLLERAGGTDPDRLRQVMEAYMTPKSRTWLQEVVYRGVDAPIVHACLRRFDNVLNDFEGRLTGDWLTGPRYSVTEAAFAPYMARLDMLHLRFLWRDRPRVSAWIERMKARASFADITKWYAPENRDLLDRHGAAHRAQMEDLIDA